MTIEQIGLIRLNDVRFSYFYGFDPFVAQPSPQNPKPKPVFTCHFLMRPDHPDLPRLVDVIKRVAEAKWKDTAPAVLQALKLQDKICLHNGNVTKAGKPEYAGLYYVSGNNERRFAIYDANRSILTAQDGRPYSGCWGNGIIDIYAQDNQFGKRINATITGVQFLRHDDAFGAGAPPARADEFPNVSAADAPIPAQGANDPTGGLL